MVNECKLLGNMFSYLIQVCLGFSVIGTLFVKRYFEFPKRDYKVWFLDISKILIGGFLVHIENIFITSYILTDENEDQCSWYFINFLADCTLGVLFVYLIHECIVIMLHKLDSESNYLEIGNYDEPIQIKIWVIQTIIYLSSITINKLLIVPLLYLSSNPLSQFGSWIFSPVRSKPNVELILVMIVCPWILSSFQFIMFDCMLKYDQNKSYMLSCELVNLKKYYPIRKSNNLLDLSSENGGEITRDII